MYITFLQRCRTIEKLRIGSLITVIFCLITLHIFLWKWTIVKLLYFKFLSFFFRSFKQMNQHSSKYSYIYIFFLKIRLNSIKIIFRNTYRVVQGTWIFPFEFGTKWSERSNFFFERVKFFTYFSTYVIKSLARRCKNPTIQIKIICWWKISFSCLR